MTGLSPPQAEPVSGVEAQRGEILLLSQILMYCLYMTMSIPALRATKMINLLHMWMAHAIGDGTL
jgi:hypothetical protein